MRLAVLAMAALLLAGCGGSHPPERTSAPAETSPALSAPSTTVAPSTSAPARAGVPRFAHIVVAVLENHAYDEVIASRDAPFLDALAASGAVLTRSYAITHPSEPNYLALFSGSTQGLTDDSCPHSYTGPNLASALIGSGRTFTGYSEDLPAAGYTGCNSGAYARKHNPWVNFAQLPPSVNQPMSAFPADFARLPAVAFVVPNLNHDMHDGTLAQADQWLRAHLGGYAAWARTHDSVLIVTGDEDDYSAGNRVATLIAGAHVRVGQYAARTDHYGVLRTILDSCRLTPFAAAASAAPITSIWSG